MLTWKFWAALRRPPEVHPLFRRNLSTRYHGPGRPNAALFIWLFMFSGFGFCWSVAVNWLPFILLTLILMANTGYSLMWAMKVSDMIVQEKEQNRYDLVGVMPSGPIGASWSITVGELHRNQTFAWLHFVIRLLTVIILLTLVVAVIITVFVIQNADVRTGRMLGSPLTANTELLFSLVFAFGLVISFYIDHIQSLVLSTLFGIYASTQNQNRGEIRLRVLGGFLFIQLAVYVICAMVCLVMLPQVYVALGLSTIPGAIGMAIAGVVFFYALRELVIRFIWRIVIERLNTDALEFDELAVRATA